MGRARENNKVEATAPHVALADCSLATTCLARLAQCTSQQGCQQPTAPKTKLGRRKIAAKYTSSTGEAEGDESSRYGKR